MSLTLDEAVEVAGKHVDAPGPMVTMTVEAGAIRLFAEAIGDPNPLYRDPEYARSTRWGGIIAPPTFLCVLNAPVPLPRFDYGTMVLNGGTVFECFLPVRPGDVISAQGRLENVRAVRGRSGEMLMTDHEVRYLNQDGQLVALGRTTAIQR
jgi:acyl dehydratase